MASVIIEGSVIRRIVFSLAALGLFVFAGSASAYRDPPPDATGQGPNTTTFAEYRLPAAVDTDILDASPPRAVEVWARVYRPDPLPDNSPLLIFLHGNHATCGHCITGMLDADGHCDDGSARHDDNLQYTTSGTCPTNYVSSPSHAGYGYMADTLASWGYVVVSLNVNRGINAGAGIAGDNGLNLVRGRMILRHLELLSRWTQGIDPTPESLGIDLTGKLDLMTLGFLGHSRGGEGIRAALQQYIDDGSIWPARIGPANLLGMFEIGPVDGQTSRVLTPSGVSWEVILPMCDGDVSNLQGIKPYDRVRYVFGEGTATPKGNSTVYGANHNYFNTEWQQSDSSGCTGPNNPRIFNPLLIGSPEQQQVARSLAMAMFRGTVGSGANSAFINTFDPLYLLPPVLDPVTRIDRGYTASPKSPDVSVVLEDFRSAASFTSSNLASFTRGTPSGEHDSTRQGGTVTWTSADPSVYLESDFLAGVTNISGYAIFEFDVDRVQNVLNPVTPTNFHVQLVQADGTLSDPVSANNYAVIDGPQGGPGGQTHVMLKTARIPLGDFTSVDPTQIKGVRFTFDDTTSGAVVLSTIAADFAPATDNPGQANASLARASAPDSAPIEINVYTAGNVIRGARSANVSGVGNAIVMDLDTREPVLPKDALTVVKIGSDEFELVDYRDGNTRQLSVTIPQDRFNALPNGANVVVQYRSGDSKTEQWVFGALNKNALKN
jgi:hypothetical protein